MSFTDYIADALTSHIANEPDIHDFIIRQPNRDDQLIYVDIEENALFLITVEPAIAAVAPPEKP